MKQITANEQYLGTCIKCEKYEALLESFCWRCRQKHKEEFKIELNKMGFEL